MSDGRKVSPWTVLGWAFFAGMVFGGTLVFLVTSVEVSLR